MEKSSMKNTLKSQALANVPRSALIPYSCLSVSTLFADPAGADISCADMTAADRALAMSAAASIEVFIVIFTFNKELNNYMFPLLCSDRP